VLPPGCRSSGPGAAVERGRNRCAVFPVDSMKRPLAQPTTPKLRPEAEDTLPGRPSAGAA
jgi:hypothetical protein